MSHQLEIVKGDVLGRERLKMNYMFSNLFARIAALEAAGSLISWAAYETGGASEATWAETETGGAAEVTWASLET